MSTRFFPHFGEGASERATPLSSLASVGLAEWLRGLLSIGAIVLAIGLVELSRHGAAIPPRFLAAVAAIMALALVGVGAQLEDGRRLVLAILAATVAFLLACLAAPQSPVSILGASFAVQSLVSGALALTGGVPHDCRRALLGALCFFHATVAASLAMGS